MQVSGGNLYRERYHTLMHVNEANMKCFLRAPFAGSAGDNTVDAIKY